jgi:hypothetical protein
MSVIAPLLPMPDATKPLWQMFFFVSFSPSTHAPLISITV